ncbi:MAG: hypothetical protein IJZ87_00920 [Bacteroidales bacterium]|nr:hypothetical protein [Bacteroidales bacterium]
MKKKILVAILIVITVLAIIFVIWKLSQPKEYEPEVIYPEVFEAETYDTDLMIGLWQAGTVYYRYNEDGTGTTWDTADDVMESEASKFTWEVKKNRLTHYHKMEVSSAIIPKVYTVKKLDLANLEYQDDFKVKSVFVKVE